MHKVVLVFKYKHETIDEVWKIRKGKGFSEYISDLIISRNMNKFYLIRLNVLLYPL